jgi:hypothetical protein
LGLLYSVLYNEGYKHIRFDDILSYT